MRYLNILLLIAATGALQGCFPLVVAGAGETAIVAGDRRTAGIYVEDQSIELKASRLISEKYKDSVHVNVNSFNRQALLTGEVPTAEIKDSITRLVGGVQNVKAVANELAIAGQTSLSSRSNDALITSNVKLRFVGNKTFSADHVRVTTENGVVYLMGMVYHKEADAAAEVASTTGGVQRVVKVFEYLD